MNRTFFFFLTGLCLLLLALACRHTPDVVVPVDPELPVSETVTTPTGSKILSTTYTIPASPETAYANVPQPPADCRIVKIITKSSTNNESAIEPELVTIDGTTFRIGIGNTTTYVYDSQRRLVLERRVFQGGQDSVRYIYSAGQVVMNKSEYDFYIKGYNNSTYTYLVDNRGYPRNVPGGQKVDADGFVVGLNAPFDPYGLSTTRIVKDMNIISESGYVSGGFGFTIKKRDYYIARPAVPALTPFINRSSRNLEAGVITSTEGSIYWRDGSKQQHNRTYTFDSEGRVKRELSRGFTLTTDWFTTEPIYVKDYEYTCP
jgi:hypothetical protein